MLVPEFVTVRVLTICGWRSVAVARLHQTIEIAPGCWREHLKETYRLAEGRTVAALERQNEG